MDPASRSEWRNNLEQDYEFRLAIECNAARLAAKHRTKSELKDLKKLLELMSRNYEIWSNGGGEAQTAADRFGSADSEFHVQIARASHVPKFVAAVEDIRAHLFEPVGTVYDELRADANSIHEQIYEAIEAQDESAAFEAMRIHISDTYSAIDEYLK